MRPSRWLLAFYRMPLAARLAMPKVSLPRQREQEHDKPLLNERVLRQLLTSQSMIPFVNLRNHTMAIR